jgi:hypothetical protein
LHNHTPVQFVGNDSATALSSRKFSVDSLLKR